MYIHVHALLGQYPLLIVPIACHFNRLNCAFVCACVCSQLLGMLCTVFTCLHTHACELICMHVRIACVGVQWECLCVKGVVLTSRWSLQGVAMLRAE